MNRRNTVAPAFVAEASAAQQGDTLTHLHPPLNAPATPLALIGADAHKQCSHKKLLPRTASAHTVTEQNL